MRTPSETETVTHRGIVDNPSVYNSVNVYSTLVWQKGTNCRGVAADVRFLCTARATGTRHVASCPLWVVGGDVARLVVTCAGRIQIADCTKRETLDRHIAPEV